METENIHVYLRVRPFSEREDGRGTSIIQRLPNESIGGESGNQECTVIVGNSRTGTESFTFDAVDDFHVRQEDVFQRVARPVCDNCLLGYNGTILA